MTTILHIDASPRGERSVSRQLSARLIEARGAVHPNDKVIYRDLRHESVPPVTEAWVIGAFTPAEGHPPEATEAMRLSDALIDEFVAADRYVLGIPMHNFHVPSVLKAYVDQIVRIGRTFSPDWKGLVHGKKMLIITSRGGAFGPGSPVEAHDHQEPWLRSIFGFIGVTDVTFVHAEGMNLGDEARQTGLAKAEAVLDALANSW